MRNRIYNTGRRSSSTIPGRNRPRLVENRHPPGQRRSIIRGRRQSTTTKRYYPKHPNKHPEGSPRNRVIISLPNHIETTITCDSPTEIHCQGHTPTPILIPNTNPNNDDNPSYHQYINRNATGSKYYYNNTTPSRENGRTNQRKLRESPRPLWRRQWWKWRPKWWRMGVTN